MASLRAALDGVRAGCPAIDALAVPDDRMAVAGQLAEALGVPVIGVPAAAVAAMPTPTRSAASLRYRHSGSVAEAVALAAAGPGARLIARRHVSPDRMATCAIAEGFAP